MQDRMLEKHLFSFIDEFCFILTTTYTLRDIQHLSIVN